MHVSQTSTSSTIISLQSKSLPVVAKYTIHMKSFFRLEGKPLLKLLTWVSRAAPNPYQKTKMRTLRLTPIEG